MNTRNTEGGGPTGTTAAAAAAARLKAAANENASRADESYSTHKQDFFSGAAVQQNSGCKRIYYAQFCLLYLRFELMRFSI